MKHNGLMTVSSEFVVRQKLNDQLNEAILPKQLDCISWDARHDEYREYFLVGRTQVSGSEYGNVDRMINLFGKWKSVMPDKLFTISLEYESYQSHVGNMYPTGESGEVGTLIKVEC